MAEAKRNPNGSRRPAPKKRRKQHNGLLVSLAALMLAGVVGLGVSIHKNLPDPELTMNSEAPPVAEDSEQTGTTTTTVTEAMLTTTETSVTTEKILPPGSVTGISLSFYDAVMKVGDDTMMPLVTMQPDDAADVSEKWETSDPAVATVDDIGRIKPVGAGSCTIRVTSVNNPDVFAEVKVRVADPDKPATTKAPDTANSTSTTAAAPVSDRDDIKVIDGVTYVQGVMIVNKTYALPSTYNPNGLTQETKDAFAELQRDASAAGYSMYSVSDFRSYEQQVTLYNNYVARDGKEAADTYSARPGHSEHQTGLTIDVNCAGAAFHDTPEAKWLAENCWKYGFIIRFPRGKEDKTGYTYESWHIRYVGKDWAKKIYDSGLCLEEYFNLESKYAE